MAGVLAARGCRALVFRGDDGLDELTVGGDVAGLGGARRRRSSRRRSTRPSSGIAPADARRPARRRRRATTPAWPARFLDGETGPVRDAVLLNAAAALVARRRVHGRPPTRWPTSAGACGPRSRATAVVDCAGAARRWTSWVAGLAAEPPADPATPVRCGQALVGVRSRARTPRRGRAGSRCGTRCASRCADAGDLVDPAGDDVGERLVLAHPHHRDQVDLAGDRVDLADPVQGGDGLGDLRDGESASMMSTMAVITGARLLAGRTSGTGEREPSG